MPGIEALNGSQIEVDNMIKEFDKRRKFLVSELNLIDEINCVLPGGAFLCISKIKKMVYRQKVYQIFC